MDKKFTYEDVVNKNIENKKNIGDKIKLENGFYLKIKKVRIIDEPLYVSRQMDNIEDPVIFVSEKGDMNVSSIIEEIMNGYIFLANVALLKRYQGLK